MEYRRHRTGPPVSNALVGGGRVVDVRDQDRHRPFMQRVVAGVMMLQPTRPHAGVGGDHDLGGDHFLGDPQRRPHRAVKVSVRHASSRHVSEKSDLHHRRRKQLQHGSVGKGGGRPAVRFDRLLDSEFAQDAQGLALYPQRLAVFGRGRRPRRARCIRKQPVVGNGPGSTSRHEQSDLAASLASRCPRAVLPREHTHVFCARPTLRRAPWGCPPRSWCSVGMTESSVATAVLTATEARAPTATGVKRFIMSLPSELVLQNSRRGRLPLRREDCESPGNICSRRWQRSQTTERSQVSVHAPSGTALTGRPPGVVGVAESRRWAGISETGKRLPAGFSP